MSIDERLSTKEVTAKKARTWLTDVRSGLQRQVDAQASAGYLASIDLSSTPASERHFPNGVIDEGTDRFLSALEKMSWNEHVQDRLATLEDRRTAFMEQHQADIGIEQFAALRTYLDTPDFYN